jgi:hypothetical protein
MNNILNELSAPGVWEVLIGTVIVGLADAAVRGLIWLRRKIRERFGIRIDINGEGFVFGEGGDDDNPPPSAGAVGDEEAFAEMMRG